MLNSLKYFHLSVFTQIIKFHIGSKMVKKIMIYWLCFYLSFEIRSFVESLIIETISLDCY